MIINNFDLEEIKKLGKGTHNCFFYKKEEEYISVILPFIIDGINNNEKIIIVNDFLNNKFKLKLKNKIKKSIKNIKLKQIEFFDIKCIYYSNNKFSEKTAFNNYKNIIEKSFGEGYKKIRITGDGTFIISNPKNVKKLINYEFNINLYFDNINVLFLCSYNISQIQNFDMINIFLAHENIIINDLVCKNKNFNKKNKTENIFSVFLNCNYNNELEYRKLYKKKLEFEKLEYLKKTYYEDMHFNYEQGKENTEIFVTKNIENLIIPLLKKLYIKSDKSEKEIIDIIIKEISSITDPFGSKLDKLKMYLTPAEMNICSFIKNRLSSKEIANIINISNTTVDRHRNNIRKKLNIDKTISLYSYLNQL